MAGVTFLPAFLVADPDRADLDRVVDHIVHMLSVARPAHMGVGFDFDGMGPRRTRGLEDAAKFPALTVRMLERGLGPDVVEAVLGGNFLRVLRRALAR